MRASDFVFLPMIPFIVLSLSFALGRWQGLYRLAPALVFLGFIDYRYKDICYHPYRGPARGFSVGLPDLLFFALFLLIIRRGPAKTSRTSWWPAGLAFILMFDGWGMFTSLFAYNRQFALFTVFKLFKAALLFWTMVNMLEDDGDVRTMATACGSALIYLGLLVLYHKYVVHKYVIRAQGPFSHCNTLVMVANLLLPICFSMVMTSPSRKEAFFHAFATYCGVICVIFTKSRGGLAMMAASFMIVLLLSYWSRITSRKAGVLVAFLIGGLITGAMAAPRLIARFQNADPSSKEARVRFNNAAANMARDHFFGIGLNNYPYVLGTTKYYYDVYPELVGEWKPIGEETSRLGVCHNIYFLVMAETGYTGLFLFLLMISYYCLIIIRPALMATRGDSIPNTVAVGLCAGFFTLHAQGMLEWIWFQSEMLHLYFIFCAVAVAIRRLNLRKPARRKKKS